MYLEDKSVDQVFIDLVLNTSLATYFKYCEGIIFHFEIPYSTHINLYGDVEAHTFKFDLNIHTSKVLNIYFGEMQLSVDDGMVFAFSQISFNTHPLIHSYSN